MIYLSSFNLILILFYEIYIRVNFMKNADVDYMTYDYNEFIKKNFAERKSCITGANSIPKMAGSHAYIPRFGHEKFEKKIYNII